MIYETKTAPTYAVEVNLVFFSSIVEPYASSNLISYFTPGQTEITENGAYCFAAIIFVLKLMSSVYVPNYALCMQQLAIEVRVALSSLIYRKSLRLTPAALSEISLGNVVTLITKDVLMFEKAIWMVHEIWIGAAESVILCYLLYASVGPASFIGVGVFLAALPLQCEYRVR